MNTHVECEYLWQQHNVCENKLQCMCVFMVMKKRHFLDNKGGVILVSRINSLFSRDLLSIRKIYQTVWYTINSLVIVHLCVCVCAVRCLQMLSVRTAEVSWQWQVPLPQLAYSPPTLQTTWVCGEASWTRSDRYCHSSLVHSKVHPSHQGKRQPCSKMSLRLCKSFEFVSHTTTQPPGATHCPDVQI